MTVTEVEEHLKCFRSEFNEVLSIFLNSLEPQALRVGHLAQQTYKVVRDFTLQGGKRLRPFLICTSYHGYGGLDRAQILKASCAFELMNSHLLIHDDICDRSHLRRGRPTVHKVLERLCDPTEAADSRHSGMSLAILAGNLAAQYSVIALSESGFSSEQRDRALRLYMEVIADETYGQILDMQPATGSNMLEGDILTGVYYKTTRYTFEGPLRFGATLAGAPPSELQALSSFSNPLGNVFQMTDDILGLFGDEAAIGKPVGSDVSEGKHTVLLLKTLELACDEDNEFIRRCWGNQDITQTEMKRVRDIMASCGSLRHVENMIDSWVAESKRALETCTLSPEARRTLLALPEFIAKRRY